MPQPWAIEKPQSKKAKHDFLVLKRMEKQFGRDELLSVFSQDDDPKFIKLMEMALSPGTGKKALARLARECGISHHELADKYRKLKIDEGMMAAASHLPEVLEHIAIDSKTTEKTCWKCFGNKTVSKGRGKNKTESDCPECQGKGTVKVIGDAQSRKLMLDAMGITSKSGPLIDARQLNITGAESLEDTIKMVRPALESKQIPTIPAEVVE